MMHTFDRLCRRLLSTSALALALVLGPALLAQAPVITTNSPSRTVNVGTSALLSVTATGAAPLSYQWYVDQLPIGSATNSTLTILATSVVDSGTYLATVTNALGAATTDPIVITVLGPPVLTATPTNQTVYVGQPATFAVSTYSTAPVTYQWFFQGTVLAGETSRVLVLPTVTTSQAGNYSVRAITANGTTASPNALLTVNALPQARLRFGEVTATNRVRVPVNFTARGLETRVSFSASWDPAVYMNATFEPELDPGVGGGDRVRQPSRGRLRTASLPDATQYTPDNSQLDQGRLGITLAWSAEHVLLPGDSEIGQLVFDLLPGQTNVFAGRLSPTNQPTAATFEPAVEGADGILLEAMRPQVVFAGVPTLDRQTGYLQQTVQFANPGDTFLENVRLEVIGLKVDSLTNLVVLANQAGVTVNVLIPYVDLDALAPTELNSAILQYYVTDRKSVPTPTFKMYATDRVHFPEPTGRQIDADVRRTNGLVLVEFPTVNLRRYYIQYADSLTNFIAGNVLTSVPHVEGTGTRRQWVDIGLPRTVSPPGNERYYRVREAR